MTQQDKLPVLPFPRPATSAPQQTAQADTTDQYARAVAALQSALRAEERPFTTPPAAQQTPVEDAFTPIGVPKPVHRSGRAGAAAVPVTGAGPTATTRTVTEPRDKDPLARRITAIHLPHFAMERWTRWATQQGDVPPADVPYALATEGPHGPVIHATNRAADLAGVHTGARVVDMRALCPELTVTFADRGGDAAALEKLMLWTRRWCPWTAITGPASLVLDTTGSDHLWGGEIAMLRNMEERLAHLGLSAQLAISPTHGASWALAQCGTAREICTADDLSKRMSTMPVRALRLTDDTVQLLHRLGLKSVGDLAAVPRVSLARRFSRAPLPENPLLRLDQMMGRLAEPVSATQDPPRFAVQANLAEPVLDPTPHLPELCRALCADLQKAGCGARRLRVSVFRSDGEVSHVDVTTAQPNRDPDHLLRLFDDKLERINPGFGFDLITLAATTSEPLSAHQSGLTPTDTDHADLARLMDRLTARLGAAMIRHPAPKSSHIPERGTAHLPATQTKARPHSHPQHRSTRPFRLFDHPEEVRVLYAVPEGPPAQFVWRRLTRRIIRYAGPERIAPEWWQDKPGTRLRDYYRVEDQYCQRLWLYRNGVLGDERGQIPCWFVHGVFT